MEMNINEVKNFLPHRYPFLLIDRVISFESGKNLTAIKNVSFNNIGPTIMSGRVADIDVNPNDPTEFYVGYASGGLWYTNNNA